MVSKKRIVAKVLPTAKLFSAIAHPYRTAIVYLLSQGDVWEQDVARELGIPASLAVHHLSVLEKQGWIKKYREGRHAAFRMCPKTFSLMTKLFEDSPVWRANNEESKKGKS